METQLTIPGMDLKVTSRDKGYVLHDKSETGRFVWVASTEEWGPVAALLRFYYGIPQGRVEGIKAMLDKRESRNRARRLPQSA